MSDIVRTEIHDRANGRIGVLKLNRPADRNPLDKHTMVALNEAIDALVADEKMRAVIVTGEGESFSAGGDMKGYLDLYVDEPAFRHFLETIKVFFDKLENGRLLSVAAVNGTCVAGGFEMALACDMIVMSSSARMGDGHLKFWQLPGGGGTQRLPRAVGFQVAKHLLYSYELWDAERCRSVGLAADVFPADEFMSRTLAFVDRMLTTQADTFTVLKRLLKSAAEQPLDKGIDYEIDEVVGHAIGVEATAYKGLLRFVDRKRLAPVN